MAPFESLDNLPGESVLHLNMIHFEYEITKHSAVQFSKLVYFCSDQGECNVEDLPSDQLKVLRDILNERGEEGWELTQILVGKDGVVAFWKRAV